jgi:hypothetical protein
MNQPLNTAAPANRLAAHFAPSGIRWRRVLEVRQKIANGDYERSEVLEGVVDRLLEEIEGA